MVNGELPLPCAAHWSGRYLDTLLNMQRMKEAFAKRRVRDSVPGRQTAVARLTNLTPKTKTDKTSKTSETSPDDLSRLYVFEKWEHRESKPANVVVAVYITSDDKRCLKEYNDRVLGFFRDEGLEVKGARGMFGGKYGVRSTFRRVFLRGA